MFSLLPLLKGWGYKKYTLEKPDVLRGAEPHVKSVRVKGWLFYLGLLTNDAYGTLIVEYPGADLETLTSEIYPEKHVDVGAVVQDPSGWCSLYNRPNPMSTAGIYYLIAFSGGFQGAAWPLVPTITVKLYLREESTQESAYIRATAGVVAITDDAKFTDSLCEVLKVKETNDLLRELIGLQRGGR